MSFVGKLLSYPARHIRWKIIVPFAALTIVIALAGTYLTTRLVTGSLAERFDNQLAEASRSTADSLVRRERRQLEVVRSVSFTEGVSTAAATASWSSLDRLILPLAVNTGSDRVEVLGPDGRIAYGVKVTDPASLKYEYVSAGEAYADWPFVKDVLGGQTDAKGNKYEGIAQTADGYLLYTAGPLYDGTRLAGVVLVGSRVDSLLPAIKLEALADVTLYDPAGRPIGSTFRDEDLAPVAGVLLQVNGSESVREKRSLFGRDFDLLYGPLVLRGSQMGYVSIALPSSFIASASWVTRAQMTALFSLATGSVILVGWLLAGALSRPIMRLAGTASAVSSGDLSARSGVAGSDEIGTLALAFDNMTDKLQRQHLATVQALASAIDARDPYTMGHSVRVGRLALRVGSEIGLSKLELQQLEIGGYLHDIGKIGVRDSVLLKTGSLSPEERCLIEDHPRIGLKIIESIELLDGVRDFVAAHHEKLDGSGYPEGLRNDDITIFARVGAVADIYDALTTERPYKPAFKVEDAIDLLFRESSAGRLDPVVVEALVRVATAWELERNLDPTLRGFVAMEDQLAKVS